MRTRTTDEMMCVHDEEMFQALGTDRPHELLGAGIRVWGPERGEVRSTWLVTYGCTPTAAWYIWNRPRPAALAWYIAESARETTES